MLYTIQGAACTHAKDSSVLPPHSTHHCYNDSTQIDIGLGPTPKITHFHFKPVGIMTSEGGQEIVVILEYHQMEVRDYTMTVVESRG